MTLILVDIIIIIIIIEFFTQLFPGRLSLKFK